MGVGRDRKGEGQTRHSDQGGTRFHIGEGVEGVEKRNETRRRRDSV